MEDIKKICKGCMKYTSENGKCPECGFNENEYNPMPHHLKPGTVLAGKYMLGKSLGEGGFGITYIGIDLNLNMRVAIKEYFPSGCVTRNTENTDTITVFDGDMRSFFEHGRDKFLEEARTIARFNEWDGIVSVKDFFSENGTAYIVMEFLDGETLKDFLKRNGGRINPDDALNMIKPVLGALMQLHKKGFIHRDISPDNIMITKNGKVKLIDFGATRDINPEGNKSLSIQLKPGYAPEEQYRTHGKQGPWTDVYALCATIYRMITGQVPAESNERLIDDTLIKPSAMGIAINPNIENALMQGLNVDYRTRIQDIELLYNVFYNSADCRYQPIPAQPVYGTSYNQNNTPPKKSGTGLKVLLIVLSLITVLAAAAAALIFGNAYKKQISFDEFKETSKSNSTPTEEIVPTATLMPTLRPDLYRSEYEYKRMSSIHSSRLTDDITFEELKNVMLDFNEKCVEYMNNGNNAVFQYLKADTTAYDQQISYKEKHSNIYEVLNGVDVINARFDGSTYYVWVTERMTVTENGETKDTVDNWVYRLEKSGQSYVIIDYTRDPAYN